MSFDALSRHLGVLVLAVGLAACGGGGGFGAGGSPNPPSGSTTSPPPNPVKIKTISLTASSPQLLSSASTPAQGITLTSIVVDQHNNVVPGVTVQFSATRAATSSCGNGGVIKVVNGTTDNSGTAMATLYTGGDPTDQTIDVMASAAGASASLSVPETGTKLSISGPAAVGLGGSADYTIALTDADNNAISRQALSVTSALGNGIVGSGLITDSNGQATVTFTGTIGGNDTLTARPNSCTTYVSPATRPVQVAAQNMVVVAPNAGSQIPFSSAPALSVGAAVAAGGGGYVVGDLLTVLGGTSTTPAQLIVSRVSGSGAVTAVSVTNAGNYSALPTSPAGVSGGTGSGATFTITRNVTVKLTGGTVGGQTVAFNATRGSLSAATATTNASGIAAVAINQPSAAGNAGGAVVTAVCSTCSPQLEVSTAVQFNATTPSVVALQASPATVATNGTSAITATVRDANDNPVANQRVQFTLTDDSGGGLQQSSATTDSSGQAVVTYQAGGTTSSANGVKITGAVSGAASGTTTLTVGGQALRIVLGTGNTITALNSTQYQLPYSVLVTDAAGNPPPAGTVVNLTTNAIAYQKGYETYNPSAKLWEPVYEVDCTTDGGCASVSAFGCYNEDKNLNGILDLPPDDVDYNHNNKLEPGNVTSVPLSVTLDANGTGQFDVTYPKDRAYWVQVFVAATVTVNGDQGVARASFILPGLSSDYTDLKVAPPGQVSPYGDQPPPATTDVCANPPPG